MLLRLEIGVFCLVLLSSSCGTFKWGDSENELQQSLSFDQDALAPGRGIGHGLGHGQGQGQGLGHGRARSRRRKWNRSLRLRMDEDYNTKREGRDASGVGEEVSGWSGQRLRLRGSSRPGAGRVEVYVGGRWGMACADGWDEQDAGVLCKQMGYERGCNHNEEATGFGEDASLEYVVRRLSCDGSESSIFLCNGFLSSQCSAQRAAGVVCYQNTGCKVGQAGLGSKCFKVVDEQLKRGDAEKRCVELGGHLAVVASQKENDFLSDLLYATQADANKFWVGGKKKRGKWHWQTGAVDNAISFTNWFPGWGEGEYGTEPKSRRDDCLALSRGYDSKEEDDREAQYYFWDGKRCQNYILPFICQFGKARATPNTDCMTGKGESYRGFTSVTSQGHTCQSWTDESVPSAYIAAYPDAGLGDHNYCRNPDDDTRPWCFVRGENYDYCEIPVCSDITDTTTTTTTTPPFTCPSQEFKCADSDTCYPQSYVCDYQNDCEDASDEIDCPNFLANFTVTNNRRLEEEAGREKWINGNSQQCAKQCLNVKDFVCSAFTFDLLRRHCVLYDKDTVDSSSLVMDVGVNFYQLTSQPRVCLATQFTCSNGKCVSVDDICNGHDDCNDFSDEVDCPTEAPLEVRLSGSSHSHEGTVEVKVADEWGIICDDNWDIHDADVVCKQLGFSLGAMEAVSQARFGEGTGNILLDEVQCAGSETTINDCQHDGFRKHDCITQEAAGVICKTMKETCALHRQFSCANSKCVPLSYVCDSDNDCMDNSDEQQCSDTVEARLAGGSLPSEGRVEIKRHGIWGTVCDDEFDANAAKVVCGMLGYSGGGTVLNSDANGYESGTGAIWLDDIHCSGTESDISACVVSGGGWGIHDCTHKEDVAVKCSKESKPTPTPQPQPQPTLEPGSGGEANCGQTFLDHDSTPRNPSLIAAKVVGGFDAERCAYPWQVGIRLKSRFGFSSSHYCGASIISEYWVVSAAHCFDDHPKTRYKIRVGDHDNTEDEDTEQDFDIENLFVHPDFKSGGGYNNNDLILIQVKARGGHGITFSSCVQPICLPTSATSHPVGSECVISGWGSLGSSRYPKTLQAARLPVLSKATCERSYGRKSITSAMFCAGYLTGGVDSCQGDSGGPLACKINGRYTLTGVTSWGEGCGIPNKPGVYTKIVELSAWIRSTKALHS